MIEAVFFLIVGSTFAFLMLAIGSIVMLSIIIILSIYFFFLFTLEIFLKYFFIFKTKILQK